jgi:hypothetical protein
MPTITPANSRAHDAASPVLNVVIIYDDHNAYCRAIRLLANASHADANRSDLHPTAWRMDELATRLWNERSLDSAAAADAFIVSTSAADSFTTEVNEWLERAFQCRRDQPTAVIALGENDDQPADMAPAARERLRRAATAARIDFLEPAGLREAAVA